MRRPLAVALLLLAAMLALRATAIGAPQVVNDSVQYLEAARSLRERGEAATSIVHFDVERAAGRIPAPLTSYPPGYPAAIAGLSLLGADPDYAALALNVLSAALVLLLLALGARVLGLSPGATLGLLGFWALNAQVATYALSVLTEPLFTAVVLGAVVLLLAEERAPSRWRPVLALALMGMSYWIRYAGLLLVAAAHAYAAVQVLRDRRRAPIWILSLLACDLAAGGVVLRNLLLTGGWQGGNTHPHAIAPWRIALKTPALLRMLLFGPSRSGLAVALSLAALALFGWAARRARPRPVPLVLPVLLAVYAAGIAWLASTTPVSYHARMFVPVLPLLGLAGAAWLDGKVDRRAGLACLAAYALVNGVTALAPSEYVSEREVARSLAPVAPWVRAHVPADAVLLATEGQLTGRVLGRPTVSAVDARYSDLRWTEEEARRVAEAFGVGFVVVQTGADRPGIFAELAEGRPPPWLELAAAGGAVRVYRRTAP